MVNTTANNKLFKTFVWRWTGNQFEGEFTIDAEPDLVDVLEEHLISKWLFDLGGMVGKVYLVEIHVSQTPPMFGFGFKYTAYTPTSREVTVRFIRAGDVGWAAPT